MNFNQNPQKDRPRYGENQDAWNRTGGEFASGAGVVPQAEKTESENSKQPDQNPSSLPEKSKKV